MSGPVPLSYASARTRRPEAVHERAVARARGCYSGFLAGRGGIRGPRIEREVEAMMWMDRLLGKHGGTIGKVIAFVLWLCIAAFVGYWIAM